MALLLLTRESTSRVPLPSITPQHRTERFSCISQLYPISSMHVWNLSQIFILYIRIHENIHLFFFFFFRESVLNSNAGFLLAVDLVDWSLRSSSNLQQLEVWPSAACTSQCSLGATGLERKCSICLSHHCRPAIFTRNVSANTLVFCWAQCWHNRKVFYPSGSVPGHELHCLSTLFFAANN